MVIKDVNTATLDYDHYNFKIKIVQIIFKLKHSFVCNSFNFIFVIICDICKEDYIEETGEGKIKLRDRVRVYCPLI